jgi:hypothetical protein
MFKVKMGIETFIEEKCTDIDTLRIWVSLIVGLGVSAVFMSSYKSRDIVVI